MAGYRDAATRVEHHDEPIETWPETAAYSDPWRRQEHRRQNRRIPLDRAADVLEERRGGSRRPRRCSCTSPASARSGRCSSPASSHRERRRPAGIAEGARSRRCRAWASASPTAIRDEFQRLRRAGSACRWRGADGGRGGRAAAPRCGTVRDHARRQHPPHARNDRRHRHPGLLDEPPAVIARSRACPVVHVLRRGDTRASILTHPDLQIDLRVVPRESFGAALQYFTGSKDHNVSCAAGDRQGLQAQRVRRLRRRDAPGGRTEEDVYAARAALDPARAARGRGEIELARGRSSRA